jgi:outer membrane receptor protein involved in Fe transport
MKLFALVVLFWLANITFINAQPPRGGAGASVGRIYGKIVNAKNGKAVDGATLQAVGSKFDTVTKQKKTIIFATVLTEKNGDFTIENLPLFGITILKISAIGYNSKEEKIQFIAGGKPGGNGSPSGKPDFVALANATDKDLGNIKLSPKDDTTIVVTATRQLFTLGADKKVFNVDKSLAAVGGTGVDIMRNIPIVQVDIDGNVLLRNNSPQVFVDGRPTTLSLDQIPADAIASVELITNPSAKFDASGGNGGIINVVLKKNKRKGYFGSLRTGIDMRGIPNLGGDINIRRDKINYFLNANFNGRKTIGVGESSRTNLFTSPVKTITQQNENKAVGFFMNYRGGLDYFIDNRNTLTFSGRYTEGRFKPEDRIFGLFDSAAYLATPKPSFQERNSNVTNQFLNRGASVAYKHNFAKAGQELTGDFNFNKINNKSNTLINTNVNNIAQLQQTQNTRGSNQNIVSQIDYVQPLRKDEKFETGVRYQQTNVANKSVVTLNNVVIPSIGYDFKSVEKVFAAYGNYSNSFKKGSYALGLRIESSELNGALLSTGGSFTTKFPFSLFPSAALSYKLTDNQDIQINYSRRVNRPGFFQLIPFIDFSDSLNVTRGNPNLKPEFTNSVEMSYNYLMRKNNNLLVTLYAKQSTGLVSRFQFKEPNPSTGQDILINGWINANNAITSGVELVSSNPLAKVYDLVTSLNIFYAQLNIKQNNTNNKIGQSSFFIKQTHNIKFSKNYSLQLIADYQGKTVLPPGGSNAGGGGFGGGGGRGGLSGGGPFQNISSATQGFIRPNYGVDLAVRKDFGKNKAMNFTFNIQDIFKTRVNDVRSESPFFVQDVLRRRDWRLARITFSYRFGKQDNSLFKRKNTKTSEGGGGDN